jgi:hypothetical protein
MRRYYKDYAYFVHALYVNCAQTLGARRTLVQKLLRQQFNCTCETWIPMSAVKREELYNNAITALRTHLKLRDDSVQALDNAIEASRDAAATATLQADLQSLLDPELSSEEELTDITSSSSSSSRHGTSPPRHRDVITISSASPPRRRSAGGGGGAAGKRALAADSAPLQASRLRPRTVRRVAALSSSSSSSSESSASPPSGRAASAGGAAAGGGRRKSRRRTAAAEEQAAEVPPPAGSAGECSPPPSLFYAVCTHSLAARLRPRVKAGPTPLSLSDDNAPIVMKKQCLDCGGKGQCSSCRAEEAAVPPPAGSAGECFPPPHPCFVQCTLTLNTHSTCSISANGLVFQS